MEIRNSIISGEKGLFTLLDFNKGDTVYILSGEIFNYPTRETIHIGDNKHIYDNYGIYINHSFEPNIEVCGYELIAIRDIKSGEEIVFNYNHSEINMASPFYVDGILVSGEKNKST